jgi:hypothetical protein
MYVDLAARLESGKWRAHLHFWVGISWLWVEEEERAWKGERGRSVLHGGHVYLGAAVNAQVAGASCSFAACTHRARDTPTLHLPWHQSAHLLKHKSLRLSRLQPPAGSLKTLLGEGAGAGACAASMAGSFPPLVPLPPIAYSPLQRALRWVHAVTGFHDQHISLALQVGRGGVST